MNMKKMRFFHKVLKKLLRIEIKKVNLKLKNT